VSVQSFDNFSLLLQLMQDTRNLATNMRWNAGQHKAMAAAQSPSLAVLAQFVNDAAASYLAIITSSTAWVTANQTQMSAAVAIIGATLSDLNNYKTPLQTAATNLQNASKTTYAQITTACDAVLAAVSAPASIHGV